MARDDIAEAHDAKIRDIGVPRGRKPQPQGKVRLPAGTTIVSCDNHWSAYEDIFIDRFPAHLKHKAPRPVVTGEGTDSRFIEWYVEGKGFLPTAVIRTFEVFE
ncbi:MAG: hypothetical protein EOP61_25720, partial [Sphingomonadales bacterium]